MSELRLQRPWNARQSTAPVFAITELEIRDRGSMQTTVWSGVRHHTRDS